MSETEEQRIRAVVQAVEDARMALLATGETYDIGSDGRHPSRSDRYNDAIEAIHAANQARARLLIDLIGKDADSVPADLIDRLGLGPKQAAHILRTAQYGTPRMMDHVFGSPEA
ncbi:hypothetical protein [Nocardia thailandica]|uniref:hypothetical protein n=1 Tax=Nocardia thailandica TaxID=257275 RepID=UPI0002E7BDC8|nr:hypothetical protein [Nocardia thailandica]